MDKTTRYLTLLLIIIVFFVLAPMIVLYVSGRGFEIGSLNRGTGILDIQSNPSGALVFLNGKETDKTPATIRFIKEGTYDISVKKDGWRPWQKRLFIESGKATYAGMLDETISLLPQEDPSLLAIKQVNSYLIKNDLIFASTDNNEIVEYSIADNEVKATTNLPLTINSLDYVTNDNYLSALTPTGNAILFDIKTKKLVNIPTAMQPCQNIDVTSENTVLCLKDGSILANNLTSPQVWELLDNTLAFLLDQNLIYTARSTQQDSLQTYLWTGREAVLQTTLLKDALPNGNVSKLYLTSQKELFYLAGQSLYRVNTQLDLINSQATYVNLDKPHQLLTFQTPSEIYYYNFLSAKAELLSRVTEQVSGSIVVPNLGYGFLASAKGIEAIEIDNRNGQNNYLLAPLKNAFDLLLSPRQDKLFYLNEQTLYQIIINK